MMRVHVGIVGVAVLWAAFAVWRQSAEAHIDDVEKQSLRHFASLATEKSEPLHPVRWGDRILVPKHENDPREYAETYLGVDSPVKRTWLTGGDLLGRLSGAFFHGAFALTIIALASSRYVVLRGTANKAVLRTKG